MRYRADISGLRALAVVPVVLFHADHRLMPGGFVGVDVFFVISGYLITSLIAADMAERRFSLAHFYDRRVRRILPAFALVAGITALAALILFPPRMLADFGSSLTAASTFLANRHFLATTFYFGPAVEEQPLLHTWSLAVEEQFYLVWPLLLLVLFHPRLAKIRPYVVWGVLIVSLFIATRNAMQRPGSAFFNFNGRAWELLLGASLALGLLPAIRSQRAAELIGAAGIALIAGACLLFDGHMLFPGVSALVPTVGALFVLWAGEGGRTTHAGRLLGREPLVWIGLISYSLYLWHWPVISFAWLYFGPDLPPLALAGLVGVAVVLAALSWRFVEVPFRRGGLHTRGGEWRSIGAGLGVLALLAGVGVLFSSTGGLPGRASALVRDAEAQMVHNWPPKPHCFLGPNQFAVPADCRFGDPDPGVPLVALWGDSFADQHGATLDGLLKQEHFGLLQMTKAGCSAQKPVSGSLFHPLSRETQVCNRFRSESLAAILANPAIRVVVIGGNWTPPPADDPNLPRLQAVVDEITASGRGVILMAPAPGFENGGGRCLVRRRFIGLSDEGCAIPREEVRRHTAPTETALMRIAHSSPLVRLLILWPRLCDEQKCLPAIKGRMAMNDGSHLNRRGADAFRDDLKRALSSLSQQLSAPAAPGP